MKTNTPIIATLAALAAVAGAWLLVSMIPLWALRALFIVTLALLPAAFWIGWQTGRHDAKAFLDGVNRGTGVVMSAGGKVADLRAAKLQEARQAQGAVSAVTLPDVTRFEIVDAQSGRGEMIDL